MKRYKLVRHLHKHGCELLREGGKHSWYLNPEQNKRSSLPRHNEIKDILANKICRDLGVEKIK